MTEENRPKGEWVPTPLGDEWKEDMNLPPQIRGNTIDFNPATVRCRDGVLRPRKDCVLLPVSGAYYWYPSPTESIPREDMVRCSDGWLHKKSECYWSDTDEEYKWLRSVRGPDWKAMDNIGKDSGVGIPSGAKERKEYPITSGVLDYFPDAIAEIAHVSYIGTNQHHPGQPMHWDKNKSTDEPDALVRHLMQRGTIDTDGIRHSAKMAWRALALLQRELDNASK